MRRGGTGLPAGLAAIAVVVTLDVWVQGPLTGFDHVVHRFTEREVRGPWFRLADTVHLLGQRWTLLIAIVPLAVLAGLRSRSLRPPLMTVVVMGALAILQAFLKSGIPRTYPESGQDVLFAGGDAYPSGHTINGFVFIWLVLELAVIAFPPLATRLDTATRCAIALTTGLLTGLAVTLADHHWLTDALASLCLGPLLLMVLVTVNPFRTSSGAQAAKVYSSGS